jgi:hypothetical protein
VNPRTRKSMAEVSPTRIARPKVCRKRMVGYPQIESEPRAHAAMGVWLSHDKNVTSLDRERWCG